MTSRYRCNALTNWAMKPLTLGAGHLWVLMSPWRTGVKWYMKCFICWTADMKSNKLWSSQLWTQFKQLRIEDWTGQDFHISLYQTSCKPRNRRGWSNGFVWCCFTLYGNPCLHQKKAREAHHTTLKNKAQHRRNHLLLDTLITRKNGAVTIDVYWKPTHTDRWLDSHHELKQNKNSLYPSKSGTQLKERAEPHF